MRAVWSLVEKVAPTRSTVLITGESGTGKELVARAIHARARARARPSCRSTARRSPRALLESELFGHEKGAFTGATRDAAGPASSSRASGTLFLDEIGEIPLAIQVKLLRVLQEREVEPRGRHREDHGRRARLAATNRDLEAEVKAGRFREDLYYRLNVITLELPPLRERAGDIPLLAEHFLERQRKELGRPGMRFSSEALAVLAAYPFPGNVRQLENIVERAATLADGDVLSLASLPPSSAGRAPPAPVAAREGCPWAPASRWSTTWTRPSGATCWRPWPSRAG